jgi:hypothetical protein
MKNRFSYIKTYELLQNEMSKGIVKFALAQAQENNCEVKVCVNNKSQNEIHIQKAFDTKNAKVLISKSSVSIKGIDVNLQSIITLKKDYNPNDAVYLLLYPSPELLETVESIETASAIIVFSEESHSEHLVAWSKDNDVLPLNVSNPEKV